MLIHQSFQLDDELAGESSSQVGVDAHLDRLESQLLEPGDLRAREVVEGEVLQRRTPPQVERGSQHLRGGVRLVGEPHAGLADRRFESSGID